MVLSKDRTRCVLNDGSDYEWADNNNSASGLSAGSAIAIAILCLILSATIATIIVVVRKSK